MSLHFHRLIIKEVRKETAECVSLLFEIPDSLQESFQFTQGQNLVLKTTIDGQELRRNYSICSSPLDHELRVAIKKIKGGVFSSFANEKLQAGHSLEVMPPTGKFYTPLNPAQQKNYLALAAGSGITPLLSIIKTTLATESNSSFTLVYGNRFNAGAGSTTTGTKISTEKSSVKSQISILLDGRQLEIEIPLNSNATILDAALEQGADLPFACKGGMCCTCKAKLVEGEVSMDIHWGLEEEEIEQGFILTCQSHPKTEKIVVDFDSK